MKGRDSHFSKFPPFWIIDKRKRVINCRPAQVINVNIRKSWGKKAQKKKSSALNISGGVADWLTHQHTRARPHMYTLQMYSWRIKLEVFSPSLSLIKKEGDQI